MTMNPFFEDIVIEMSGQGPTGKTGNSIESIVKTSTELLTDTYTITFTWGNTTTFEVENGNGIVSITKTGTNILTDTYTILFSNGTTTTFDVENGRGISSITVLSKVGLVTTYLVSYNDGTSYQFTVNDGNGISSIDKVGTNVLEDTYQISFTNGTTTTFTVDNGRGIVSIEKSGSHDLQDVYTITYNDGSVSTFSVMNGEAATVDVGTISTGAPGTNVSVTNSGTNHAAVFNFTIPRGDTGNGVESIVLVSTVGLAKTYRVTYTDGDHYDYTVLDGNGISGIELISTSGLDKTYRISMTDGSYFDYVVHDGNGILSVSLLSTSGATKTYRISFTDGSYYDYNVVDGSDEWGAIVGDIEDQEDLIGELWLFDDSIENTVQTVTFNTDGQPSTITHVRSGSTLRTDTFVWGTETITETRTLADGRYITIVTNLDTLVQTISEIQEGA